MERPEPLVVEAKIIDRHQSYDAWRAVSLCVSAEGVDVTPLNDPSARVRVLFQSIKGVRKLEEHIVEFEWRVPADASTAKKTCFFCPSPQVEPIRMKFGACVQYLIQQRKRNAAASEGAKPAEPEKPAASPRSTGSGLLSFLFTAREDKAGSTPPLPPIPAQATQGSADAAPASPSPSVAADAPPIDRPLSPLPVAAVPREGSKSSLSALLNWGASASDDLSASGRRSGRAAATATPPPSQAEKPSESAPPQAAPRSGLGFSTLFRGSWNDRKDAPPPVDPKVVETMQKEIKDLEAALKEANQRHQDAAHRLEALQHLDPILTAADEKANLATRKIQEADLRVAETEQKVRTLETQLAEAQARVKELSETHAALQAKARNADDWERRAREAESKLATSESNLTAMQNHYDSAIPKLVASENRVRDAETRALDAGRKLRETQDEVAKLRSILKSTEATVEQHAQTIAALEKRLDAAGRLVRAAEKTGDIAAAALKAEAEAKAEEKKEEAKAAEAPTQQS